MGRIRDLTNQRFGRLVALKNVGKDKKYSLLWECICDCGNTVVVSSRELSREHRKSCGCLKETYKFKHGYSKHPLYDCWVSMKARCNNKRNPKYPSYGGRGITVCEEWENDFCSFLEWSLKNGYDEQLTLDRIDNNKGYYPENCRWTTRKVQQNNTRHNRYIEYNGETKTLAQWCELLNLKYSTMLNRFSHGYTAKQAFETPIKTRQGERK